MQPIYIEDNRFKRTYNEIVPNSRNEAFVFRIFKEDKIYDFRHKHEEVELIYIKNGQGRKSIGDNYEICHDGDIDLIGSGVPHFYTINPVNSKHPVEAWVIQFDINFLGGKFFDYTENTHLKTMLLSSGLGVYFLRSASKKIYNLWQLIAVSQGIDRLTQFLKLLSILAIPGSYRPIIGGTNENELMAENQDRMLKIRNFIQNHYSDEISLTDVAQKVNLSKPAFCNLFKKTFNVCFSSYLAETRLSHASRLLAETDLSVNEIFSKVGFSNQSYFNRCFKVHFRKTPLAYRKSLVHL